MDHFKQDLIDNAKERQGRRNYEEEIRDLEAQRRELEQQIKIKNLKEEIRRLQGELNPGPFKSWPAHIKVSQEAYGLGYMPPPKPAVPAMPLDKIAKDIQKRIEEQGKYDTPPYKPEADKWSDPGTFPQYY